MKTGIKDLITFAINGAMSIAIMYVFDCLYNEDIIKYSNTAFALAIATCIVAIIAHGAMRQKIKKEVKNWIKGVVKELKEG